MSRRSLLRLWCFALATPLLYMVVSMVVGRVWFTSGVGGFCPLAADVYAGVLAVVAVAVIAAMVGVLRSRMARSQCSDGRAYARLTYIMLGLCDGVAFTGMVLYLIQGEPYTQGALSMVAWAGYAVCRPVAD